jgi:DnaK suppressor protein
VVEAAAGRLALDRAAARARLQAMDREYEEIVAASADANSDDEHDPEGATIAFERAQLGALRDQARRRLDDIDRALARTHRGQYGICEGCGRSIAAHRLAARPAARTCIDCARSRR